MKRRIAAMQAVVVAIICACALSACGFVQDRNWSPGKAPHAPVSTPSNLASLRASPLTIALKPYGYKLVGDNIQKHKHVGYIYVHCAAGVSIAKCGSDRHNGVPMNFPNIYTEGDKVTELEGPHDARVIDNGNYRFTVPDHYQDFVNLSRSQQKKLFSAMREVANSLGLPPDPTQKYYPRTSIGQVTAWVQYGD